MTERAAASYIPAIHSGYINFIRNHPYPLFVLDEDIIETIPKLDRDVRAMEPEHVVQALGSLGIVGSVQLLGERNLEEVTDRFGTFVMPNDEANHIFAENHLPPTHEIEFVDTFLRWDMAASLHKMPVESESYNATAEDVEMMKLAIAESEKSRDWWRQVGAALKSDDGNTLSSCNVHLPSPDYSVDTFGDPRSNFDAGESIEVSKVLHAEAGLIAKAARRGVSLEGSKLYVTTFPCPNCAKLVAESGVKQVYFKDGYSLLDALDTLNAFGVIVKRISLPDAS